MKILVILMSLILSTGLKANELLCQEGLQSVANDFDPFQNLNSLDFPSPYYLYYESQSLEGLQEIKNCLDYLKCGKSQESIVDDPKKFRLHLWTNFTMRELKQFVHLCPIKDLEKNFTIRVKDQKGEKIEVSRFLKELYLDPKKIKTTPAIFHEPSIEVTRNAVKKIGQLLKEEKAKEAQDLVLKTWSIDVQDYTVNYSGKDGGFAVANHKEKTIVYGKDWLRSGACDFIRMIRHEAEHVAQVKMSNSCRNAHNFHDHTMRERAAHLNDARFLSAICPGIASGESSKNFCLNRFREKYFKD